MNLDVLVWFVASKLIVAAGINPIGVVVAALFWPQQQTPVVPVDIPVAQVAKAEEHQ